MYSRICDVISFAETKESTNEWLNESKMNHRKAYLNLIPKEMRN